MCVVCVCVFVWELGVCVCVRGRVCTFVCNRLATKVLIGKLPAMGGCG